MIRAGIVILVLITASVASGQNATTRPVQTRPADHTIADEKKALLAELEQLQAENSRLKAEVGDAEAAIAKEKGTPVAAAPEAKDAPAKSAPAKDGAADDAASVDFRSVKAMLAGLPAPAKPDRVFGWDRVSGKALTDWSQRAVGGKSFQLSCQVELVGLFRLPAATDALKTAGWRTTIHCANDSFVLDGVTVKWAFEKPLSFEIDEATAQRLQHYTPNETMVFRGHVAGLKVQPSPTGSRENWSLLQVDVKDVSLMPSGKK